jgi:uncharacterized protein (DUF1786 family)
VERIDSNINVDAALEAILKASGSALKNYTIPGNLDRMREAMRKVMSQSYVNGSTDAHKAFITGCQYGLSKIKTVPSLWIRVERLHVWKRGEAC